MMNFRAMLLLVLATWGVALVVAGCGDQASNPISPSLHKVAIRGMVTDRFGQTLAGAVVEVLDGSRAGTRARTNGAGRFELRADSRLSPEAMGITEEWVTLRASYVGFQTRTLEEAWSAQPDIAEIVTPTRCRFHVRSDLPNMKILTIAPLLSEAIRRIHVGESVSVLFDA
jgi:hypothetical protein